MSNARNEPAVQREDGDGTARRDDDHSGAQPRLPEARQTRRWRWFPGWIWSIPIAALLLVGWLVARSIVSSGPTVTVVFPLIANLRPEQTKVTFEGYNVGQVDEVHLEKDLRHLRVKLDLNQDMANHLGPGTQFWIIGKSAGFQNLTAIRALVEGPSIGISPRPGRNQGRFVGLAKPPVIGFGETGTQIVLHTDKLGSLQRDTPIYYLGEKVGEVVDTKMTGPADFIIDAFIMQPYDQLVHMNSRFWRAGPIHISTGGNGPTVQFQSIPALLEGAIAFTTPDVAGGQAAKPGAAFALYDNEDAAENAPDAEAVSFRVVFHNASGVPADNAPVQLMGKRIGSVSSSALQYDTQAGKLSVVATIAIEPHRIDLTGGMRWTDPHEQVTGMVRRLVAQGLRASLTKSPPLIGGEQIALRIVPGQGNSPDEDVCQSCTMPEIPTEDGDGSVTGIETQASDILAKLNALPLQQIGDNLRDVAQHLAAVTSSPKLPDIIARLDRSAEHIQRVTAAASRSVPPALAELKQAVAEAQSSLGSASDLLAGHGAAANMPGNAALPETLYEIKNAARAIRELADLLDRNPSSLVLGRANQ